MRISAKYRESLECYLEWESVKTPFSNTQSEREAMRLPVIHSEDCGSPSAEEWLCEYESRGNVLPDCREIDLLSRYWRGKANRDWWNKETGRNWPFIPEEFLAMLGPLPFIELFGRDPITTVVRYFYDNRYAIWEWNLDCFMLKKSEEWDMPYYERDDRDSALRNAWHMVKVKWIAPVIYRMKRRFLPVRELKG